MKQARKPCTHLAGEFFVAAELSRLGFNVAMTFGNAKRVDLIIEDEGGRTHPIQVKALARKANVGWPMPIDISRIPNATFVLVVLNDPRQQPDYYILGHKDVVARTKTYSTRGILDISKVKDFKDNWGLLEKLMTAKGRGRRSV